MAAPSYTEDLTDITLAESVTGWAALGGGASGLAIGVDYAMEGTYCVDKQITAAEKGHIFDNGSTITPGASEHFWVWVFLATPGQADTRQNRGLTVAIGTATTAYNKFHVEGKETYGAIARVARCYPIRYVATSNASHPYRTLVGSPGANPQWFGALSNITGTVKSSNLGVDAIRRGTGAYLTAGELISAGDGTDNPGTFDGFAAVDNVSTARWGILTSFGGGIFELQGRFVVGQNNAGTATLARFKDSNKTILLVDTFHSQTDFTQFIFDHASTRVEWTNINITALGTINPGKFIVNANNSTLIISGGTYTGIGITTLRSNSSFTGTTWRSTDQITLNGATMTGCTVDSNTAASAVVAATPAGAELVTGTTFISDGTGNGLEIGGTATDITLSDLIFTGYSGTSTNAAVFVNIGSGVVNLNISGGTDITGNVRTAGATVNVISAVSVTFNKMKDNSEVRVYLTGTATEVAGIEDATAGTTDNRSFTWSAAPTTVVDYVIHNFQDGVAIYKSIRVNGYTVPASNTTIDIQQQLDRNVT